MVTVHVPSLFDGFFMGGFECASQRRADGKRLDLTEATGHERLAAADYALMRARGLCTVRDGVRWHRIESAPGRYDLSSFSPMLAAARTAGVQPIWDLCHYGWPDHVDIWRPAFVAAFAAFARTIAQVVRDSGDEVPFYCLVNEISYFSWAGSDAQLMQPMSAGRSLELKHQLVRATIAGIEAVRDVDPRARFVAIDPTIHVMPSVAAHKEEAEAYLRAQHDGWLLLSGELWPGLGGDPKYLDIVGINYYGDNQWWLGGETIFRNDPAYVPLRTLLQRVHRRLDRPVFIAETGAEGDERTPWASYVAEEVLAALELGVPIEGLCLYPVLDYPGWIDERHCATGLYGQPSGDGQRPIDPLLAEELKRQQARFNDLMATARAVSA